MYLHFHFKRLVVVSVFAGQHKWNQLTGCLTGCTVVSKHSWYLQASLISHLFYSILWFTLVFISVPMCKKDLSDWIKKNICYFLFTSDDLCFVSYIVHSATSSDPPPLAQWLLWSKFLLQTKHTRPTKPMKSVEAGENRDQRQNKLKRMEKKRD